MSPRSQNRAISKNAISFFLRETISGAGALGVDGGLAPRAHSIRGVSASMAFLKNWSVQKVLQAATWRSNSVFASFYLRDIAHVYEDCSSLGPFIAAGQVINSPARS